MPGWSYCSSRAAVHSKPSENTENHQYPLKTSLSGKWDCLGKHRCTVTLVVSLNSLVCMNCFEILRWDVLGKQNNYSKVQGSAFFLYPQIFFMSDFWLCHCYFNLFLAILTFSWPNGIAPGRGCAVSRFAHCICLSYSFLINLLLCPQSCSSYHFIARYQMQLLSANSNYFANKCHQYFYYLATHQSQCMGKGLQRSRVPAENKYHW